MLGWQSGDEGHATEGVENPRQHQILAELGYAGDEIAHLITAKVIAG